MRLKYVKEAYEASIEGCKTGEAWEYENAFADAIFNHIMVVIAGHALSNDSALEVFKNLKKIYENQTIERPAS